jgi:hypothetical protein
VIIIFRILEPYCQRLGKNGFESKTDYKTIFAEWRGRKMKFAPRPQKYRRATLTTYDARRSVFSLFSQ